MPNKTKTARTMTETIKSQVEVGDPKSPNVHIVTTIKAPGSFKDHEGLKKVIAEFQDMHDALPNWSEPKLDLDGKKPAPMTSASASVN